MTACPIWAKEHNIERHDRVCAELHFNICKEIGVKLDSEQWYDHVQYQNQSKQVMKVRLPYCGANKCELTELFPTINRTS